MQRMLRTFIAVEVSSEIRSKAQRLIGKLSESGAKIKWVEPQNLHLTLKFLGDVEMLEMPQICSAVDEAVAGLPPFDLEAIGAGAFPTPQRPRTIWLGIRSGSESLVALHDAVEEKLAPLGFRREGRRYVPHLTLGRVRSTTPQVSRELAALLETHRQYPGGSGDVSEVVVMSSELGRDGPVYDPLSHAELRGS